MSIIATILWVLAALLAGVVGAVVAVPFRVRAAGLLSDDAVHGVVAGSWLFGLIRVDAASDGVALRLLGRPVWRREPDDDATKAEKEAAKKDKQAEKAEKEEKAKKRKHGARRSARAKLRWFLDHRSTLAPLLGRAVDTFQLHLRISGTVGLDDPADTAELALVLSAVERWVPAARLDVRPDYLDEVIDVEGEVGARLWILAIVLVGVRSLFEVKTWKMLRGLA